MYYGLDPYDKDPTDFQQGDRFTTRVRPEPCEKNGTLMPSRFEKHAFEKQIGKVLPLVALGVPVNQVKVVSATIAEDGSYADLEYEVI